MHASALQLRQITVLYSLTLQHKVVDRAEIANINLHALVLALMVKLPYHTDAVNCCDVSPLM